MKQPYAPLAGLHPLESSASMTFQAAHEGLENALSYLGSTDQTDRSRMRVALAGVASACDAFKAAANAYANILGHVSRGAVERSA